MYVCNACAEKGVDFSVPADEIGVALMDAHLESEHGVRPPIRKDLR